MPILKGQCWLRHRQPLFGFNSYCRHRSLLPPPLPPSLAHVMDLPPISRPTGSMLPPSTRSDMRQLHRMGSEVTLLNPSKHLYYRTRSHWSPSLFSGLREGRPPAVHQCRQNRGRCLPSGSSSNVNGLPYWEVVLNTPQEGPHDSAAITEALPQTGALGRQQLKSRPSPQTPSKTYGKIKRGEEGGDAGTIYLLICCSSRHEANL